MVEFNDRVMSLIKTYPTDGTHGYDWPKVGKFDGVTQDLFYKGVRILECRADKCTYCCGLTFEVWFRISVEHNIDLGSAWNVENRVKPDWFVATGKKGGPVTALVPRELGIKIERLGLAKPGDFIQFWRQSGSGHSVIYISHTENSLTYWSTQMATKGIGYRTEYFSNVRNPITDLYMVRAIVPEIKVVA